MADNMAQQCAGNVLATFHTMMKTINTGAGKRLPDELPFQQFRAMSKMKQDEGSSLSQVAQHLGCTLSAASKLVDILVEKGYVSRESCDDDRRKLTLDITDIGDEVLNSVNLRTVANLAKKLETLSANECAMLSLGMELLRSALLSSAD